MPKTELRNEHVRMIAVDALRGFALSGVVIANSIWFSGHASLLSGASGRLDATALAIIGTVFTNRYFLIFSFLFGFGFTVQEQRHPANSHRFAAQYARRMTALFAFGAVHASLLFVGDILMLYAVLGGALWFCRRLPVRTLMQLGVFFAIAGVFTQVYGYWLIYGMLSDNPTPPGIGFRAGFLSIVTLNTKVFWNEVLTLMLLINGVMAMGMFFFGRAAYLSGYFPPSSAWFGKRRIYITTGLATGLAASFAGFLLGHANSDPQYVPSLLATIAWCVAGPVTAVSMALVAYSWFADHQESVLVRLLADTGRNTLSAYFLHSVIFCGLFYGWGFDLYDSMSASAVLLVAFGVYAVILTFFHFWQRQFRYGPFEWLWRSVTDMRWKALRN
jgi:uncharacterized protein